MSDTASSPAIDLAQLARYTGGDAALDAEVLALFRDQCSEAVRELHTLLERTDLRAWRERAHALKGAALGVGASRVAELACQAEQLDTHAEPAKAAGVVEALADASRLIRAFVEARIAR